jgi:hypothetical protein
MRIPSDKSKYSSKFRYVEIARFVPSLNRIIREKINDIPILIDIDDVQKYASKHDNTGIYTSIWQYDSQDLSKANRIGSLYFDIDNSDVSISWEECKKLYSYLSEFIPEDSLIVYYTGKKGFHIECEALALNVDKSESLHNIYRYIASDINQKLELTSLDFSVYDQRRMWRLPGSKHQSTNLYKTKLNNQILFSSIDEIIQYSSGVHDFKIPEQSFDYKANQWYRDYVYQMEVEKSKPKDFLAHLDHESRLFICSILTYTEDSIQYLHEILSNCNDYNYEKSSAHINDWIKRRQMGIGGRPYTCERANAAGVGCGDCSLDQKNKWVKIGEKFIETKEKSSPSPIRFAYSSLKKGGEEND